MDVKLTRRGRDIVRLNDHVEAALRCEAVRFRDVGACRHGWYALAEPNRLFDTQADAQGHADYRKAVPAKEVKL